MSCPRLRMESSTGLLFTPWKEALHLLKTSSVLALTSLPNTSPKRHQPRGTTYGVGPSLAIVSSQLAR